MLHNPAMSANRSASKLPWHLRLLFGLTNWGLFCAGAVNLTVGTWYAFSGSATIAATSLTAGLILLFAATIDRFESLKGLGVEAKTRQLDQKIEQADDALRRLKELAEVAGASLIDLNSKMGRWDSAPRARESYALAQKVRGIMSSLGSDPSSLRDALKPWMRITCCDLCNAIAAPLQKLIQERQQALQREQSALTQPLDPKDPALLRITSDINALNIYGRRFQKIFQFEVDDFPDRFLQLLDDVPLVAPQGLAPIKAKARQFAPSMIELREKFQLINPELWFAEIDK